MSIDGKRAGGEPFLLRYKGRYGVYFPAPTVEVQNEFSLSGRSPSKLLSAYARRVKAGAVDIYFCRNIVSEVPVLDPERYETVELRIPNNIWDGEAKNLNGIAPWRIRYGQPLDPIRGYLFTSNDESGVTGTVTLNRIGNEIEVTLDANMGSREEQYNPALKHPQMRLHYRGAVLGDTYCLFNQMAVGPKFTNIGSVLMDKSDAALLKIYLCEDAGIKELKDVKGDYMTFVIPSSKLSDAQTNSIKLNASDCTEISYCGTPLVGTEGSVTVLYNQIGENVTFAADITSATVRYQIQYSGKYMLPSSPNVYQIDPANYVYFISANNRTTFYVSSSAESYADIKKYPYSVVTVDNELMNAEDIDLTTTKGYFSIEYYESAQRLFSVSSEQSNVSPESTIKIATEEEGMEALWVAVTDTAGDELKYTYFFGVLWQEIVQMRSINYRLPKFNK